MGKNFVVIAAVAVLLRMCVGAGMETPETPDVTMPGETVVTETTIPESSVPALTYPDISEPEQTEPENPGELDDGLGWG